MITYLLAWEAEAMGKYKSNKNKLAFIHQYENPKTETKPAKFWQQLQCSITNFVSRIFTKRSLAFLADSQDFKLKENSINQEVNIQPDCSIKES